MATDTRVAYLLCYDIRDHRRLGRVHRVARDWGQALQYSVFRCYLNHRERRQMLGEIADEIDAAVDDVRLYEIETRSPIRTLGPDMTRHGPKLHETD